jgi:hypothetical protein
MEGRVRLYVGERPAVFYPLYRLRRAFASNEAIGRRPVRPNTELVIEGFPRSANTFAVWAFRQAQPRDVRVAHHLHSPAQVIRAARWRIPTLVLIRDPSEAAVSLVMKDPQTLEQALRQYVSFYRTVVRHRDACVLAAFEEVIDDYGAVIGRVNDKFGTRFSEFRHSEENVGKVFSRIEERHRIRNGGTITETRIARPSSAKQEVRSELRRVLEGPSGPNKLLAEANSLHENLTPSQAPRPARTG